MFMCEKYYREYRTMQNMALDYSVSKKFSFILLHAQRLKYCVFCAVIKDEIEAANEFRWNSADICRRSNGQKNFLYTAIEAGLQYIRQFFDLNYSTAAIRPSKNNISEYQNLFSAITILCFC